MRRAGLAIAVACVGALSVWCATPSTEGIPADTVHMPAAGADPPPAPPPPTDTSGWATTRDALYAHNRALHDACVEAHEQYSDAYFACLRDRGLRSAHDEAAAACGAQTGTPATDEARACMTAWLDATEGTAEHILWSQLVLADIGLRSDREAFRQFHLDHPHHLADWQSVMDRHPAYGAHIGWGQWLAGRAPTLQNTALELGYGLEKGNALRSALLWGAGASACRRAADGTVLCPPGP